MKLIGKILNVPGAYPENGIVPSQCSTLGSLFVPPHPPRQSHGGQTSRRFDRSAGKHIAHRGPCADGRTSELRPHGHNRNPHTIHVIRTPKRRSYALSTKTSFEEVRFRCWCLGYVSTHSQVCLILPQNN